MNIREQLDSVAPFLGSLIEGPFGIAAEKIIAEFLVGDKNANEISIQQALMNATPFQLEKLKKMDSEYNQKLAGLIFNNQSSDFTNIKNDSSVSTSVKEMVPILLAILITIGFFSVLFTFILYPIHPNQVDVLNVMLGALGTAWITCVSYYFGSSYGSQVKTQLMMNNMKK